MIDWLNKHILCKIKKIAQSCGQFNRSKVPENARSDSREMQVVLPAESRQLCQMIDFLKSEMTKYHVSEKKQFNMISAAEEVFINIADYAYEKNGTVDINSYVQGGTYYVRFSDCGKKYDPLKNKDPDITADLKDRKIGGLGVFLAKKLSDKISYTYENGQNILTIGVDL